MRPERAISRTAAVPLYHQIFLELRDEILSGARALGASVPTEAELAAAYDVSRITARRALDELAQHKLVERRRRVGTTVTFQPPAAPIEANIDQALDSLLALGRATSVEVLDLAEESADAATAAAIATDAPILKVEGLAKAYGSLTVLEGIDL